MKTLKEILESMFKPSPNKIKELVIRLNAGEDIKKSEVEKMFKVTSLDDLKIIWKEVGRKVPLIQGVTGSTRKG